MIKISKMADYGIVLLTLMARHPKEETFTARDLAGTTGLPLPMVSKVLKLLARRDLLSSHRGVKGGYSLSRGPKEISAADIIAALDGPIALTSCLDGDGGCGIESHCVTRDYWETINDRIVTSLEAVSLDEISAAGPSFSHQRSGSAAASQ